MFFQIYILWQYVCFYVYAHELALFMYVRVVWCILCICVCFIQVCASLYGMCVLYVHVCMYVYMRYVCMYVAVSALFNSFLDHQIQVHVIICCR